MDYSRIKKVACIVAVTLTAVAVSADIYDWSTSIDDAVEQAAQENKSVFVYFAGSDWCGWCARFHAEVLDTRQFEEFLDRYLVPVLIDFPRTRPISDEKLAENRRLAAVHEVTGYPTVLIVDSTGSVVFRTGFREGGAVPYITHLLPHVR